MNDSPTFNLIDEKWIEVRRLDGQASEESIASVFFNAHSIREITGELPTQAFAILRVLLAILQRSIITDEAFDDRADPAAIWGRFWEDGQIPFAIITQYLETWREKFNLIGGTTPFMQVAELQTTSGDITGVGKIIAELPDGFQFFTTRSGKPAQTLSMAEAARWLVHVQAYDTAGIKSGVVGDPEVKNGKKYPAGIGWAGRIGGVQVVGSNLWKTLLLNLCLSSLNDHNHWVSNADLPSWERPPGQPGDVSRHPTGPADLFTWQSRWVRLVPSDDGLIIGVVLTNANKLETYNQFNREPLSGWRRSMNQQKILKQEQVFMPVTHQTDRAMWRGLESLLPLATSSDTSETSYLPPGIISWLAHLASDDGEEVLHELDFFRLKSVGAVYGPQSATFAEVISDHLIIRPSLLHPLAMPLINLAKQCVISADEAVKGLGQLAANLYVAAGGDNQTTQGTRRHATERAYRDLDAEFRHWLADLEFNDSDPHALETYITLKKHAWHKTARKTLQHLAEQLLKETGPQSFTGHESGIKNSWMTSGQAERFFRITLNKSLPLPPDTELPESTSDTE